MAVSSADQFKDMWASGQCVLRRRRGLWWGAALALEREHARF
jgi:hypothetical protein